MARYIDNFKVILLDMMGTFMFSGDRFSEHEDYATTYRNAGGRVLSRLQVNTVISEVFSRMLIDYDDPLLYESFPPVSTYLTRVLSENDLPNNELELLDEVFALHEVGTVSAECAVVMRQLAATHRLGVVSNIWCKSEVIRQEFHRAEVAGLFEVAVFSSDYGINKPSPQLYNRAIGHFGVDACQAVFVGDSLRYDVAGAQKLGLATVWVNAEGKNVDESIARPDMVIGHLRDLLATEGHV